MASRQHYGRPEEVVNTSHKHHPKVLLRVCAAVSTFFFNSKAVFQNILYSILKHTRIKTKDTRRKHFLPS